MTELCNIMNKYGSDKGSGWHNYTELYYGFFSKYRNETMNIFELGLGTNYTDVKSNMGSDGKPGASLFGWEEFFSNSNVYGCDIDSRILFSKNRIKTFYCDQTNPEVIKNMWESNDLSDIMFDIIIDDGLHEYSANITFFENSLQKLKEDGIFIIEDIHINQIQKFNEYFSEKKCLSINMTYNLIQLENKNNTIDNNLIILRKNGCNKW